MIPCLWCVETKLSVNFVVAYLRRYCIIVSRVDKQIKCNKAIATIYTLKSLCMIPCLWCVETKLGIDFIIAYLRRYRVIVSRVDKQIKCNDTITTMYALKMLSIYPLLRNIETKLSISFVVAYLRRYCIIVSRVDSQIKYNSTIAAMHTLQLPCMLPWFLCNKSKIGHLSFT